MNKEAIAIPIPRQAGEIDSRAIAETILDARRRGVRVNIFLEQDYPAKRADRKPTQEADAKAIETAPPCAAFSG